MSKKATEEDESALWGVVTSETRPLKKRKAPLAKRPAKPKPETKPEKKTPAKPARKVVASTKRPALPQTPPKPRQGLEQKLDRALKHQREKCGAKRDLHNKTLTEAEQEVQSFIQAKGRQGVRLVLIVTGQGKDWAGRPQGAIRRDLPKWLEKPENAAWVIAWQEAYRHDGGAGAFYLHLRKQKWRAKV